MKISGIDVSHFQGQIDWQQVQGAGVTFAFMKATEGVATTDPMFPINWRAAGNEGIRRGAYHFLRPQFDAEAQAQHFLQVLGSNTGELPPALDIEVLGGMTPHDVIFRIRQWMDIVSKKLGRNPFLYTGSAFWRTTLKNSPAFAANPLWIAHYTSAPKPIVPSAWSSWTLWQFSDKGIVPGITGKVDLNAFNGTVAEFEVLCSGSLTTMKKGTSA